MYSRSVGPARRRLPTARNRIHRPRELGLRVELLLDRRLEPERVVRRGQLLLQHHLARDHPRARKSVSWAWSSTVRADGVMSTVSLEVAAGAADERISVTRH